MEEKGNKSDSLHWEWILDVVGGRQVIIQYQNTVRKTWFEMNLRWQRSQWWHQFRLSGGVPLHDVSADQLWPKILQSLLQNQGKD